MCLQDIFGIWKFQIWKHGSFGEIKDSGGHGEEGGKSGMAVELAPWQGLVLQTFISGKPQQSEEEHYTTPEDREFSDFRGQAKVFMSAVVAGG